MKKTSLFLVLALTAVACKPDLPPLPSEKPTTTSTTTSTTGDTTKSPNTTGTVAATSTTGTTSGPTPTKEPASTTTGTTTSSTTGTTSTDNTTAAEKPQPGDIANRIFQLRELQHTTLTGARQSIDAFVADDEFKAAEGLMWITDNDLKDGQGMLFVFPAPKQQSFWMQNTLIPLDIIYMAADGKVLNIMHGKPKDETSLPSSGPAQYVLELKDGMAAKLGISPGKKITIPGDVKYHGAQQDQPPGGFDGGQ